MPQKRRDSERALDHDGDGDETGPERRCVATGERAGKERLIRFVVGPDDAVVPDLAERLPGRGLWVTASRPAVETAVAKRSFARAARRPVTVAADLADRVEAGLVVRLVEAIGLARRAGRAVSGFEKVAAALARNAVGLLLEASDGAEDGRRKLLAGAPSVPVVDVLSAEELGRAFGRDRAVHVAVAGSGGDGLVGRLRRDAVRLAGFRAGAEESFPRPGRRVGK